MDTYITSFSGPKGTFRIVERPGSPPSTDYVMQKFRGTDWVDVRTWNSMSDDLALSTAKSWASEAASGC